MGLGQVLAVRAGLHVLGAAMHTLDGRCVPGAGLVDVTTAPGPTRAVGEVVSANTDAALGTLTGFENHRGHTTRGPDVASLGTVKVGTGNGDGSDGVLTAHLVGTYLHGPVLARNPLLADLLLTRATGISRLPSLNLPDESAARSVHLAAARGSGAHHRHRWGRPRRTGRPSRA